MSQWHLHDPASNNRLGPMDLDAARAQAARNPSLLAWKDGMGDWLPVRNIAELVDGVPGDPASAPPPPRNGGKGRADEIDFRIHGQEMQFVEIELDPGESAIAEAGSLMFKDSSVQMDTVFGDEEMYQHVSFRVTSNGVTSPWTDWEDSPEQQFSK